MVSPARTYRSDTPLGAVAPSSPSRGPSHCTRHPGGHDTAATTPAHVVGSGDSTGAGDGGVVARVVDGATTVLRTGVGAMTRCRRIAGRRIAGCQRGGPLVLVVVPAGGAHAAARVHVEALAYSPSTSWTLPNAATVNSAVSEQNATARLRERPELYSARRSSLRGDRNQVSVCSFRSGGELGRALNAFTKFRRFPSLDEAIRTHHARRSDSRSAALEGFVFHGQRDSHAPRQPNLTECSWTNG